MIFNSYTIKCLKNNICTVSYLFLKTFGVCTWCHTWRIQYCAKMFSQASPLIKFGFKYPDFNVFF